MDQSTVANVTAIVSAATALVAVVVGPLSGYLIAKRQITASVVSNNRQAWINQLRDQLAQFDSLLNRLQRGIQIPAITTMERAEGALDRYHSTHDEVAFVRAKIILMLNPNEQAHIELAQLLGNALSVANEAQPNAAQLLDHRERLTGLSQRILKAEWERVKSGR